MPNSLKDALIMDLSTYKLKKEDELRVYLRWLIGEAYLKKDGDTNTHLYAKRCSYESINNEIRSLVYKGNVILDYDELFNEVTKVLLNEYLNKVKNDNSMMSFDDVMLKTLSYYKDKYDSLDKNQTIKMAKIILTNYFINNHVKVFSSKNGTRDYVLNAGKDNIIKEMKDEMVLYTDDINTLINNYSEFIAFVYMSKNNDLDKDYNIENISNKIIYEIKNLNLNDRQKEYLINEFDSGNISALDGYVSTNLLSEYIKLNNSNSFSK